MERIVKHLLLRKTVVLNFQFSPKDNLRKRPNALTLKSKKIKGTFGGTFILALSSSAVFGLQNCVSDFFCIVLFEGIKGFYQSSLGNEVDFRDIMNVSPNILAKN